MHKTSSFPSVDFPSDINHKSLINICFQLAYIVHQQKCNKDMLPAYFMTFSLFTVYKNNNASETLPDIELQRGDYKIGNISIWSYWITKENMFSAKKKNFWRNQWHVKTILFNGYNKKSRWICFANFLVALLVHLNFELKIRISWYGNFRDEWYTFF